MRCQLSQNKINKGIGFGKSRVASPRRLAFLSLLSSSVFAAFLLMACAGERTIVQTVIVEKEIWVEVPGERVVETVVVEKEVIVEKLVDRSVVQTVVVERQVVVEKEVDRPVVVEKEVEVPVSVVVEKEVLVEKVVEVPVTVVVEKEVVVEVAVPETVIVEKEVVAEEEVEASATVVVEKEVVAPTTVVEKEVVEAQPSATPTPAPTPIPSTNTIKEASQTFQGSISADDDVDEYTFFQDAYGPVEISVSDIPLATPGSTHRLRVCFGGYDCRTFEGRGKVCVAPSKGRRIQNQSIEFIKRGQLPVHDSGHEHQGRLCRDTGSCARFVVGEAVLRRDTPRR